ncbi:MAG: TVP38/TMEM64 family protein [Chlamydiales bacterium]|nr:TVP38/TMEM64 family protein [Chlamydiales bacterium]
MKRMIPLIILLILMAAAHYTGLCGYLSFEQLKMHREDLKRWVAMYPILAPAAYICIYFIATALSVPGGAILSIAGGFLFPQPYSTLFVLVGATTGATTVFLIAKTSVGDLIMQKAGGRLHKMQEGFKDNAASYLLFLRLVPLFPFWLVNIAPAFFGVSLATYVWTTLVGIIPGVFAFTQAGAGLGSILDKGEEFSIDAIFTTEIKIALIALGIFALLPVVLKRLQKKHD